jgi:UDP-2-acetamido-2-deoxy-ribo-hexuluronate aminotransferase
MDTLQCAVVLAKLGRFEWEIARRLEAGQRYNRMLDEIGLSRVVQRADRTSVFAQYTVFIPDRDAVQRRLSDAGVPTAVHYPVPINEQPAYSHVCCPDCTPVASRAARLVMSLPMGPDIDEESQRRVVAELERSLRSRAV